jgi:hypothetical protein
VSSAPNVAGRETKETVGERSTIETLFSAPQAQPQSQLCSVLRLMFDPVIGWEVACETSIKSKVTVARVEAMMLFCRCGCAGEGGRARGRPLTPCFFTRLPTREEMKSMVGSLQLHAIAREQVRLKDAIRYRTSAEDVQVIKDIENPQHLIARSEKRQFMVPNANGIQLGHRLLRGGGPSGWQGKGII